ncbi:MAG: Nif3-like dinuclear metal center hexameric protein [Clostridiales bacterium]|nr:Nif3-like dinuclear metal center hexameric protein [Clostridiales bacterium]
MTCTIKEIYQLIHQLAPFDTAEPWDNVGLIVGNIEQPVSTILVALDCTLPVVEEALSLNADLIFSHHPLLFSPLKQLHTHQGEGKIIHELLTNHIGLITAHTNGDIAPEGINKTLASLFHLQNQNPQGFVITGALPKPLSALVLQELACQVLDTSVRLYGNPQQSITTLAVSSGAGGEFWPDAKAGHAQAFLSGEFKHHDILAALEEGLVLLDGGHFATEAPGISHLGKCLQNALNALQYKVEVYFSSLHPYFP